MKSMLFLILLAFSPLPAFSAEADLWRAQGFTGTQIQTVREEEIYPNGAQGLTHGLEIDAVVLRGNRWDGENIVERYQRTAVALASCNVKITQLRVIRTDSLNGVKHFTTGDDTGYRTDPNNIYFTANAMDPLVKDRTTVIYVGSTDTGNGYTVVPSCTQEPYSVLFNKHWIPEASLNLVNNGISRLYSSESHEMGHNLIRWPEFDRLCRPEDFLSTEELRVQEASLSRAERQRRAAARERRASVRINRQHVTGEERNVMQDFPYYLNNQFNADQCRRILRHPLVRAL